jgi:activating signal cointegrator complex subunit 2
MKSDILRRVEEMEAAEQEALAAEEERLLPGGAGKGRTVTVAYLDDSDIDSAVGPRGDGEGSDEGEDDQEETPEPPADPERVLVLAYQRDPKLFDRDANTRRSKARADLKASTGAIVSYYCINTAHNYLFAWQAGGMSRSRVGESC